MDLIKRTFQHIKGINPKKEKLLWEEGVFDWQDAIEKIDYYAMPKSIKESLKEEYFLLKIQALPFRQHNSRKLR